MITERYCRYEVDHFPRAEFEIDPQWGLIHVTDAGIHTTMGTELK